MHDLPIAAATITHRACGNDAVLYLNGHFDFTNIDRFEALLREHMAAGAVVSFERVTFFDCSVISAFVRLQRAARGKLVVIVPTARAGSRIFELLNVATFLQIAPDRETAFARFNRLRESENDAPS